MKNKYTYCDKEKAREAGLIGGTKTGPTKSRGDRAYYAEIGRMGGAAGMGSKKPRKNDLHDTIRA